MGMRENPLIDVDLNNTELYIVSALFKLYKIFIVLKNFFLSPNVSIQTSSSCCQSFMFDWMTGTETAEPNGKAITGDKI